MRLPQSLLLLAAAGSAAQASSDKPARPRGLGPECEYLNPDFLDLH